MIDIHTHLLPGWDDGAKDLESARKMADVAVSDGIDKIVLTPHIYRRTKSGDDPAALAVRMDEFLEIAKSWPLSFIRGAEVFIHHDIVGNLKEANLTINGSNYVFIEFPSESILPNIKEVFFNLMLNGIIPIISHPERNHVLRERPHLLFELIRMGCLGQVTARSLVGGFGRPVQKAARLFLKKNLVHVIASDAHDPVHRPPRLSEGVRVAREIVGEAKAEAMVTAVPRAILDDDEIGDWGDPIDPSRGKTWFLGLTKFSIKSLKKRIK